MTVKDFISLHNVDYTSNLVDESDIADIEANLGVRIGDQLREYILRYGYLGYEYIEFFGVNSIQKNESDMVKKTQYLHTYFDATKNLIAFEDQGDGDFYLVDENDRVFRFLSSSGVLKDTQMSLFDYILMRFTEV